MVLTNYPNGLSSFGIPALGGGAASDIVPTGKVYWIDPNNGNDGNLGTSPDEAFLTLTKGLSVMVHYDTLMLLPGGYEGNFTTPLNAVAAFCRVIGFYGSYLWTGVNGSPLLTLKARGWRISGLEFDNPTGAAGLQCNKIAGLTERGADFFQVDNCLFFGGQGGIDFAGGGTYWKIFNNQFSLISTSGKAGIWVSSASYQIPALGKILGNTFDNNVNHIHGGGNGWSDTLIAGNHFQADGGDTNATVLMNILGGNGGNQVNDNYWDLAKTDFNAAATLVRAHADDYGSGNHFKDGDQTVVLSA